jgi:hypothetical protein
MALEFFNPIPLLKKVVKHFFKYFLKDVSVSVLGVRHPYAQGAKRLAIFWLRTRDRVTSGCPAFVPRGGTSRRQAKHIMSWMKAFSEGRHFGAQAQTRFSKEFEEKDVADCFFGKES